MTNLSFHLSGVIADHCKNLGRVGKIETHPLLQICSRWSQTIGDFYDFEFSLVGKIWDGQETVKSQTVWGFPGIWKAGFRTFVSSFPTSPGNVLNSDVNIALIAFCSLAVKKLARSLADVKFTLVWVSGRYIATVVVCFCFALMEFSLKRLLSFSDCFTPAALALSRFGNLDEICTLAELGTSTLLAHGSRSMSLLAR